MIKKVLIIDDDPIQFYEIKDWIGRIGFNEDDVIPIDDDINSMEKSSKSDPDICAFVEKQIRQNYKDIVLILCDCQFMGDDDRGYVIVKHIRERIKNLVPSNWTSMVPIIGMTKAVSQDKLEELYSAGADYAFEKKCVLNNPRESETIKKFIKTQVDKFEKNIVSISDKADTKNDIKPDQLEKSSEEKQKGERLIEQLKLCPTGKDGWKQYEDIGTEIFNFLFENSFRNYTPEYQSLTADHIQRRDLVVNNTFKDANSFWRLVKNDYNSNLIIVDFKNYDEELNLDQFYNPTKYHNKIAGYFVIVFSRHGLSKSAKAFQLKLLSENKLMICLTDNDLISMITKKMKGQDPLNSIEEIFYSLCKSK